MSTFFFITCSIKRNDPKIEAFFRKFLFEEGGAYTLLGDKPITDMLIFTGLPKDTALNTVSPESLQSLTYVDDDTFEQWKEWKKFMKDLRFKNFLFIEGKCARDSTYSWICLINIPKAVKIIQDHELAFRKIIGDQPLDSLDIIHRLTDPKSRFLEAVFSDHYLSGLLHGYGEENSRIFAEGFLKEKLHTVLEQPQVSAENSMTHEYFPLPTYAASKNDPMQAKYEKQRKEIQNIYRGGNIIDITLKFLQK